MSIILRALKKTQNDHKNSTKDAQQPTESTEEQTTAENEPAPLKEKVTLTIGARTVNFILGVILSVMIAGILMMLNDRITFGVEQTNTQITSILKHLETQEAKLAGLASDMPREMNEGFNQVNQTVADKIEVLKEELTKQQSAIESFQKNQQAQQAELQETKALLAGYKTINRDLQSQIRSLKTQVDSIRSESAGNLISGEHLESTDIH